MSTINSARLAQILAEAKAKKEAKEQEEHEFPTPSPSPNQTTQLSEIERREAMKAKLREKNNSPIDKQIRHAMHYGTGISEFNIQGTETGRFIGGISNIEEIERHPLTKPVISDRLAALRAKLASTKSTEDKLEVIIQDDLSELTDVTLTIEPHPEPRRGEHIDKEGNLITYNALQNEFVTLAESTQSCVLIGAAGTGKTTCMQGALSALIQTGKIPVLKADGHKYLVDGTPGCVIIAYTRRATNNIRRVLPDDLKNNAITAHKLLEYKPEFFEVLDDEGSTKKTMRFLASRNEENPLPPSIHTIVVEESSMLSVEMYQEINLALSHKVQWIFLGDINQLPPVFGSAVLGFRLLDLPVVELKEVYRQALESPIIRLAHRILSGKTIKEPEFPDWLFKDQLKIHAWKKKIGADDALRTLAEFFKVAYDNDIYNVDEDIILIPYNKACGTLELNKHIANHIARKHQRTTYEVVAGFNKHYFSIGDKVLYDKEDAEIVDIATNASYTGARFQAESRYLDYWGHNPKAIEEYNAKMTSSQESEDDIDFLLEAVASVGEDEDRVRKASHIVTVRLTDTGQDVSIDTAADVNNLLHAYALTVHKSQGSEWRKVYLCLHQSHATMMQRELLYTAVTRAKQELYVICEPDSFVKGIDRQRIKGNCLAEKAEFFKGKLINQ